MAAYGINNNNEFERLVLGDATQQPVPPLFSQSSAPSSDSAEILNAMNTLALARETQFRPMVEGFAAQLVQAARNGRQVTA